MTFTLLFDLDDTLLDTNLDTFLAMYFKKFAGHMAKSVPPEQFINAMLRSTRTMYVSKSIDATLEQAFGKDFYPSLGIPAAELAGEIERFYDGVFPSLAPLTTPRPQAVALVDWAFSMGWKVAIATDPLFPRKAILQRLRWAGLDPEKYPFSLISDFHTFHFAKASVAFYPEFLARMGWTDEPLLMVGDSYERDVIPAQKAGLPVYWLKQDNNQPSLDGVPQGNLADLKQSLETADLASLRVDYKSPSALSAFLQATPAALHTLSMSVSTSLWARRPAPEEWSFLEILSHLRDVDREVNIPRIQTILNEDNPFITAQETDQWAEERQYNRQEPAAALLEFFAARKQLIDILAHLSQADWQRPARHTIFGPTSLRELVEFMVDHDRLHLQQAFTGLNYPALAVSPLF